VVRSTNAPSSYISWVRNSRAPGWLGHTISQWPLPGLQRLGRKKSLPVPFILIVTCWQFLSCIVSLEVSHIRRTLRRRFREGSCWADHEHGHQLQDLPAS
jgi:hypothetical protein